MDKRTVWNRGHPGTPGFNKRLLGYALEWIFSGKLPEADGWIGKWFPNGIHPDVNGETVVYIVHPDITQNTLDRADDEATLIRAIGSPWSTEGQWVCTQELWERFPWHPRVLYVPDRALPNLYNRREIPFPDYEKPEWQAIVEAEQDWQVAATIASHPSNWTNRVIAESRDALLRQPLDHPTLGNNIHTGAGLQHMPAMSYMANRGAGAGVHYPPGVMRTEGDVNAHDAGDMVELWTEPEAHEVIETIARRTNHLESARNIIRKRIYDMKRPIFLADAGLGDDATEDEIKTEKRRAIEEVYEAVKPEALDKAMQAEVDKLEAADALPADLARAKQVLIGRLEAAATGHQKRLKGALTQQAIDNWAQCVDLDEALVEIAKQCVLATIEVNRAFTVDEAKTAYSAGVAAIQGVRAANTPHWDVNAVQILQSHPPTVNEKGRVAVIRAMHPAGASVEGKIALFYRITAGRVAQIVQQNVPKDTTARELKFTIDDDVDDPATIEVVAQNLCGTSELTVVLTPTTN